MNVCDSGMTCEEKGQRYGIAATCARPECGEWCRADCLKVDLVSACERPECRNLQLTYGRGATKRSTPALNCNGYKPCCGSKDYFKTQYTGKTAYPSLQTCKQQFSKMKCGGEDLNCVPLREECPTQAPRTSSKCPRVPSHGQFKLCCGSADAYQAKYGRKHVFDNYGQCEKASRTQFSCALVFGANAESCCVPAHQRCPGA